MSNDWQYYSLKAISRMICLLPYSWILFGGKIIGTLYYHIAGRQRQRALRQIQECLGLSVEEAEKTIASLFRKLGQAFLEIMYIPALTPEKMQRYVTIENRHYLDEVMKNGQGAVILTAHIGNWEWLGAALAMSGFPVASISKSQPNDQHTRILNEYRRSAGIKIFTRGTNELVIAARALKEGLFIGLLSDQDAGPDGLFVNFLGKMSSTPIGAAFFAKKFQVPVVPVFMVRNPEGRNRVVIQQPLYYQDTGNKKMDTYHFTVEGTNIIDAMIRQYPDEWLWFQKRWNTKPSEQRVEEQA